MIGVIRARFTPTPASAIWDDNVMRNWLDPNIAFSLTHFWRRASFGQADLRFKLFAPVVLDDPRLNMTAEQRADTSERKDRRFLVEGVINKVTEEQDPDWNEIDCLLIWFAQQTDLFGGGPYPAYSGYVAGGGGLLDFIFGAPDPPKKYLNVAVCDILSQFDDVIQEMGHAFGIPKHPHDRAGNDYGDPYDSMASKIYGGKASAFTRAADSRLPVGQGTPDPQTFIGPLISAANLYYSPFGQKLKNSGLFFEVPPNFNTSPFSFTLRALDDAAEQYPGQVFPILAIIPPEPGIKQTYFLELRRDRGYDAGLTTSPSTQPGRPAVGIVIHYYDSDLQRLVYVDVLPLTNTAGDKDYHVAGGGAAFAFRVTSIGADFRSVTVLAGGGNFWRNFGLSIEDSHTEVRSESVDLWRQAMVSPCFMFPVEPYSVRHHYYYNQHTITVSSYGYEQPGYVWKINNVVLNNAQTSANVPVELQTPKVDKTKTVVNQTIQINYTAGANFLALSCDPKPGNFSLQVEITVAETSAGVIKNYYEDRTVVTSVYFRNVELEWDRTYKQRQEECKAAMDAVDRKRIPQRDIGPKGPEPEPFQWPGIKEVIITMIDKNPAVANQLINEISTMTKAKKIEIIKMLE